MASARKAAKLAKPARKARKTAAVTAAAAAPAELPAVIPQPHGGALLAGGLPGNAGGHGRPRTAVRDRLLQVVEEDGVDFIRSVVRGEVAMRLVQKCEHCGKEPTTQTADEILKAAPAVADRIAAVDKAAKYGVGPIKAVSDDEIRERVGRTLLALHDLLPADTYREAVSRLKGIWR